MKRPSGRLRRIATDTTGYLLILAALATGWLPGPGGIPLLFAGLGLLSIHNRWARRIRTFLLKHGARFSHMFFPEHVVIQIAYDGIVIAALVEAGDPAVDAPCVLAAGNCRRPGRRGHRHWATQPAAL